MPMPNRYMQVQPGPDLDEVPQVVNVIVEIPKGRRSKFEVDKVTGLIKLDRYLYSSAMYPGEYGIIPRTLAEDGDPLDALVMVNEPTFPGCLIEARPIGLFRMTDKGDNDFKILCVPNTDPMFEDFESLWRVPKHYLREVENFFATYKALERDNNVSTQGWADVDFAHTEIVQCIKRYEQTQSKRVDDPFPASFGRRERRRETPPTRTNGATHKAPPDGIEQPPSPKGN